MNNQKITKNIVILYHAECNDGFGGAWAAWKKFGDEADYISIEHQMPLPEDLNKKQIFFIDIVPDKATLKKVIDDNISVVGIDHHKTSEAEMHLFKEHSFDNNHSGSFLAWKYFHPEKPTPKFLLLIEDMDLWKWGYPETDKFASALFLYDYDFNVWDDISDDIENEDKFSEYLKKGEIISNYKERVLKLLIKGAYLVDFEGLEILAVNAPHFFASSLGHELAAKKSPVGIVWYQENSRINVSLRSDGSVDVSEIAKKYGGGGHKAAAGFSFPAGRPFPWKIIKER